MEENIENCVFEIESAMNVSLVGGYLNMSFDEIMKNNPSFSAMTGLVIKETNRMLSRNERLQVRAEPMIRLNPVAELQKFTVYIILEKICLAKGLPGLEEIDVSSVILSKKLDVTLRDRFTRAMRYINLLISEYQNTERVMFVYGKKKNTDTEIYIDDENVLRLTNELRRVKVSDAQVILPSIGGEHNVLLNVNDNNEVFKDPEKYKKEMYIQAVEITTSDRSCDVVEVDKNGELATSNKTFDLKYPEDKRQAMLKFIANETVMMCEVDYLCRYEVGVLKIHSYSLRKIIDIFEPEFQLTG